MIAITGVVRTAADDWAHACRRKRQYDVVFVDQVSAAVPVFLMLTRSKVLFYPDAFSCQPEVPGCLALLCSSDTSRPMQVLFYCHFPDQLLAKRRSRLHAAYRVVMDGIEESSTGQAHQILVNSSFTQGRAGQGTAARVIIKCHLCMAALLPWCMTRSCFIPP